MAGKMVMQHECDRCARVWYADPSDTKLELGVALQMKFVLGDLKADVSWSELCDSCRKTVRNMVASLAKDLKHQSPQRARRGAKKVAGGPEAPSPSIAPSATEGRVGTAAPVRSTAAVSPAGSRG
jgi:hypothetical protein